MDAIRMTDPARPVARALPRALAAIAVVLLGCAVPCAAQFRLLLSQPDLSQYPRIQLPLQVLDNAAVITSLDTSQFTVHENGARMRPLVIDCTLDKVPDSIHFIFVVDVSLSMVFKEGTSEEDPDSVKWRRTKAVLTEAFRTLRPADDAALYSFARDIVLEQDTTHDMSRLEDAVVGLEIRQGTALFDALMIALTHGTRLRGRVIIIALTDGGDNSSKFDPADVILRGRSLRIPIFTIGLGVEPGYETTLDSLARLTGGEYFHAPTSNDLHDVFARIFQSVYTARCILSYVTPDTCERGDRRIVDVAVSILGNSDAGQTEYRLPDLRSRLALRIGADSLPNVGSAGLPLLVTGELRAGEPLSFDLTFTYDRAAGLLIFDSVETAGGLLRGGVVLAAESPPGTVRLTARDVMPAAGVPYGGEDTLCVLRFRMPPVDKIVRIESAVAVQSASQHCEIIAAGGSGVHYIMGCPASLHFGIDSTLLVRSGDAFSLPVMLYDNIDRTQETIWSFYLGYDDTLARFEGYDTRGTVSEGMPVLVSENPPGLLRVAGGPGLPADSSGALITLRFSSRVMRESRVLGMAFSGLCFVQNCSPVLRFTGDRVYLDGRCEAIAVRHTAAGIAAPSPHPLSVSRGTGTVCFTVAIAGHARLMLHDGMGRPRTELFDGITPAGRRCVPIPISDITQGYYILVLSSPDGVSSRSVLVLE